MTTSNTLFMFPGQGSQSVGMGKSLYENFPAFKQTLEEASDAISLDLKKLCFEGPESDLTLTENTQPALVTMSVGAYRVFAAESDVKPGAVAGHSLGEYSALVAAQALDFATAVKLVRKRGKAMQEATPVGMGSMAAILNVDVAPLEDLLKKTLLDYANTHKKEGVLSCANFNAPGQIVIAGHKELVDLSLERLKASGLPRAKGIALQVSAPFHCALMRPARKAMEAEFAELSEAQKPKTLATPYFANVTASLQNEPSKVLDLLAQQIEQPVKWMQSIDAALLKGYTSFIEFGPGKVLQGLVKRTAQGHPALQSPEALKLSSVQDVDTLKSVLGTA